MNKLDDLHLSVKDEVVFGVCGGIAETFDIPSWQVRLATVLLTLFVAGGFFIILYCILALSLPTGE